MAQIKKVAKRKVAKKGLKGFNMFIDEKVGQFLMICMEATRQNPEVGQMVLYTAREDFGISEADILAFHREFMRDCAEAKFGDSTDIYGITPADVGSNVLSVEVAKVLKRKHAESKKAGKKKGR